MDTVYANQYRDLYQSHWWWRARESEILRQLKQQLGEPSGACDILDVGCGDGLFFEKLEAFGTVDGVEADPETLSKDGRWRNQINLCFFDDKFQPGKKYDAILMLDILEHMPDPEGAVSHAKSLLKPNGVLIATVPAFMSLWTSHDDLNHHVIRYREDTFCPLFEQNGFSIRKSNYLFHWTCPVKLLIGLKERIFGARPKPPEVPAGWVNKVCETLSRIEQATISRLPMPFGSSLMVVGSPK